MLPDMKLLAARIVLALLAALLVLLWVPTAAYYGIASLIEGQAWRTVLGYIWKVAKCDAVMFWVTFKAPLDPDEDEVNGV
jgi:hypothetical protein